MQAMPRWHETLHRGWHNKGYHTHPPLKISHHNLGKEHEGYIHRSYMFMRHIQLTKGKVRLHHYMCLKGHLSGSLEKA